MKKLLVLVTAVAAVALVAGCHSAAPMTTAKSTMNSTMPAAHQDMKGEMPASK
jgi:outer membrane murein-binding lipoprotein Lpp